MKFFLLALFLSFISGGLRPVFSCGAMSAEFVVANNSGSDPIAAESYLIFERAGMVSEYYIGNDIQGFELGFRQKVVDLERVSRSGNRAFKFTYEMTSNHPHAVPFQTEVFRYLDGAIVDTESRLEMPLPERTITTAEFQLGLLLPNDSGVDFQIKHPSYQLYDGRSKTHTTLNRWERVGDFKLPNNQAFQNCYKLHYLSADGKNTLAFMIYAPSVGMIYYRSTEHDLITYLHHLQLP